MNQHLPNIPTKRLAIKLRPAAQKAIRRGHPWIFESGIAKAPQSGQAGDLAVIFDQRRNQVMALGLFDPHSPIRIKVLHHGGPTTIDENFFRQKIIDAQQKRRPLLQTDTNSYRLIHGENDCMPGLIADVYADTLVIKLYSLIWLPYLSIVLSAAVEISGCEQMVLRLSRNVQKHTDALQNLHDGMVLKGNSDRAVVHFKEHGLTFAAHVVNGHKTGFFLDHRYNRKQIGTYAKDRRVLDIFSYAGGFSVHALAGGAREVLSLDISQPALDMAIQNVQLNNLGENHGILCTDAFKGMRKLATMGKQFDLIVIDPPSFAKSEKEVAKALEMYRKLTELAIPLCASDCILLLASCSSRVKEDVFFDLQKTVLKASGRPYREIKRTLHDIDHPVGFEEGAYLKSMYVVVE